MTKTKGKVTAWLFGNIVILNFFDTFSHIVIRCAAAIKCLELLLEREESLELLKLNIGDKRKRWVRVFVFSRHPLPYFVNVRFKWHQFSAAAGFAQIYEKKSHAGPQQVRSRLNGDVQSLESEFQSLSAWGCHTFSTTWIHVSWYCSLTFILLEKGICFLKSTRFRQRLWFLELRPGESFLCDFNRGSLQLFGCHLFVLWSRSWCSRSTCLYLHLQPYTRRIWEHCSARTACMHD